MNKTYEIVAALVLRNTAASGLERQISWPELGQIFGVTKDVARHRVNRFKEKYNIVDADVTLGWNRDFLAQHTPEGEKIEVQEAINKPGDAMATFNQPSVIVDARNKIVYLEGDDIMISQYEFAGDEDCDELDPLDEPVVIEQKIAPLQFLITPAALVVVRDGQPLTIDKSHKNYVKIEAALKAGEWQRVLDLIDMKTALTRYSRGRVLIENNGVTLDGEKISGKIVPRLINCLMEENLEALNSLSAFLDKCDENPDFRVVSRIYDFIAHNDIRLDSEGNILAYKVVKSNYFDKYTGTMDNSPGKLVQMKRNKVNPKDEETCSHGLHVAAKRYIPSYGSPGVDRVVLCRVNPKDFVSIPTDYNSMKARVCSYEVIKDVTELFTSGQDTDDGIKA